MFETVAAAVRFGVSLVFLSVVGVGGFYGYRYYSEHTREIRERDHKIGTLEADLQQKSEEIARQQKEIERLDLALRLLKVEQRRAQIVVVSQTGSQAEGTLKTQLRFVEVDDQGEPIGEPRLFTIEGDLLYVDAWVVKFDDEFVEQGDPLRSSSICLFRRLFGEHQGPAAGFPLDNPLERPEAYGGPRGVSELEASLWREFWDIANDPERAASLGVRTAHGEAPSMQLRPDKVYEITLRASGGLSIQPRNPPAVLIDR